MPSSNPCPKGASTPSLAESYTESPDKLTYEFTLRPNLTFHNGDPLTTADVQFTFERYRGAAAKLLKEKVKAIELIDARRIRFHLKEPWLDFPPLLCHAHPSGASWIVPKQYITTVGEAEYQKHPVGAGPYKFVSHKPGLELVLEASLNFSRFVAGRSGPGT